MCPELHWHLLPTCPTEALAPVWPFLFLAFSDPLTPTSSGSLVGSNPPGKVYNGSTHNPSGDSYYEFFAVEETEAQDMVDNMSNMTEL